MRPITSGLLIIISVACFSQRVYFEDPDLTFSFKKPKNWQVFDNGYVVKVAPSVSDSAHTYFSITYFESPKPWGEWGFETTPNTDIKTERSNLKIASENATYKTDDTEGMIIRNYSFNKYNQRFEIIVSAKRQSFKKLNRVYKRIIRSTRVNK
ncbi:MAG: hypothetical protein AAFY41_07935 [Bacteroidota bacterium]